MWVTQHTPGRGQPRDLPAEAVLHTSLLQHVAVNGNIIPRNENFASARDYTLGLLNGANGANGTN